VSEDTKIQYAPMAPRKLSWLDGTPDEAAYRVVAELVGTHVARLRSPLRPAAPTEEQETRHRAIEAKLERIRAAMWNAGTCNLPEVKP
jgi:hypothetical protein